MHGKGIRSSVAQQDEHEQCFSDEVIIAIASKLLLQRVEDTPPVHGGRSGGQRTGASDARLKRNLEELSKG